MSRSRIGATLALAGILMFATVRAEPPADPDLQRLTGQLAQLDADPSLGQLGAADRMRAHQALDALAQTSPRSDERKEALYIAERRLAAAQYAAQAELAEHQIDQLDREHDRILLEASRRDADRARQEAERLRMQDKAREEEAQRAEADREAQQQQAAGIASDESDQARALAEARAKAAALAQQEAALTGAATSNPPTPGGSEPRGPSIVVYGSAFAPAGASLRKDPHVKAQVDALVAFVQEHPDAMIRVEGHTDNSGNPQKNLVLSQQRADALKNVLRAAGIPASRVQAVGLGAEQPVASNATAQGRARNSRVEVIALRNTN
ncbi:MAG TPA: OmpA family protein [Xanthomonadaceae bacterium]|jgi:outer membrane protein OmpA-like peptidoglycan-associated protein|nr:OmpA family protein [Xanthomonadaceae bacterium]